MIYQSIFFGYSKDVRLKPNYRRIHGLRGSVIYSNGTGKTEIAFECARKAAARAAIAAITTIKKALPQVGRVNEEVGKPAGVEETTTDTKTVEEETINTTNQVF